jgi:hypothetical protein
MLDQATFKPHGLHLIASEWVAGETTLAGVEVPEAMVDGGPYPASTNFGATSVGTLSIRRFLRPVGYQNIPTGILPEDLQ